MDSAETKETKNQRELDDMRRAELYRLMEGVEEETGNIGNIKNVKEARDTEDAKGARQLPLFPDRRRGHPNPPKSLKRLAENPDMIMDAATGSRPAEKPKELGEAKLARSTITVKHHREILTIHLAPGTHVEIEDALIEAVAFLKEHSRRYLKLGNCVDLSLSLSRPEVSR